MNIPLRNGQFALIDDEDAALITPYPWRVAKNGYVVRGRRKSDDPDRSNIIYMHRAIMGDAPSKMKWDHINRNKLDNRKSNLRHATNTQNTVNKSANKNSKSGIRGVYWNKKSRKWHATIKIDRKTRHLGFHDSLEEAARTWNMAAKEAWGEFAYQNL